MTTILSVLGFAVLFALFGLLRVNHRCNDCGGCSSGCRSAAAGENHDV